MWSIKIKFSRFRIKPQKSQRRQCDMFVTYTAWAAHLKAVNINFSVVDSIRITFSLRTRIFVGSKLSFSINVLWSCFMEWTECGRSLIC